MKKFTKTLITYIKQIHSYPFWLFLFFLYASIVTFSVCAMVAWFPHLFGNHASTLTKEILFESALGLFTIGCITAPIMDIILHVDIDGK